MHAYSCTSYMNLALTVIKVSLVFSLITRREDSKQKESKIVVQTGEHLARWIPTALMRAIKQL